MNGLLRFARNDSASYYGASVFAQISSTFSFITKASAQRSVVSFPSGPVIA